MNYERHRRRRHRLREDRRARRLGRRCGRTCRGSSGGRPPQLVKLVKEIARPLWTRWTATACLCPPSRIMWTASSPWAPAAYEKRGVAVDRSRLGRDQVHPVQQLRLCLPPCHHPSLRPHRGRGRCTLPPLPRSCLSRPARARACTPTPWPSLLWTAWAAASASASARTKAMTMVPHGEPAGAAGRLRLHGLPRSAEKKDMQDNTVKGSQFKQPMLEFSGSCAGCAETSYARLVTQLFGDRMYISNATGCSSIWGGPAATSPYTVNKEGRGPAWANSLFEDNAEHGLGMYLGQEAIRESPGRQDPQAHRCRLVPAAELKAACQKLAGHLRRRRGQQALPRPTPPEGSDRREPCPPTLRVKACGRSCGCEPTRWPRRSWQKKDYLAKKSVWIFGGDGWAYDIGYGGAGPRAGLRRGRERLRLRHRGVLQHRRPGLQGLQHRPGGSVRRCRQGDQEEGSGGDRHDLRLRLRGPDRHGRQLQPRPSRPSPRPKPTTAPPSSSATLPARCTPSRAA